MIKHPRKGKENHGMIVYTFIPKKKKGGEASTIVGVKIQKKNFAQVTSIDQPYC